MSSESDHLSFSTKFLLIFTYIMYFPFLLIYFPFIMLFKFINTIIHCIHPECNRYLPCLCIEGNCIDFLWFCILLKPISCFPKSCCYPSEVCLCCGKPSCCCQASYFRCTSQECCCCCCPDPSEESAERFQARLQDSMPKKETAKPINYDEEGENSYYQSQNGPCIQSEMKEDNLTVL